MSKLLDACCAITGADPDIAAISNRRDQQHIIANAVLLLLAAALACVGWTAFLGSFLPLHTALPAAALVSSVVFMTDRAMCAADWDLAGILQSGARDAKWWGKIAARCCIALVFAMSTATGLLLVCFSGAIDDQLQRERATANAPVMAEYSAKTKTASSQEIAPIEAEIAKLRSEQALAQNALTAREATLAEARGRATTARIEAGREKDGGLTGYVQGEGGRFKEAKRQEAEANAIAGQVGQDTLLLQKRYDDASARITALRGELSAAGLKIAGMEQANISAMQADPRWMKTREDPLSRHRGLMALKNDPVHGPSVAKFSLLFDITMVVLELSFLFVKFFCASASIYTVRLTTQTKLEAAQLAHQLHQDLDSLQQERIAAQVAGAKHRPIMRVV